MSESPAATILRHLREQPGTVLDLLDRINADDSQPDMGQPGWHLFTTHTVTDALEAVVALGKLVGHDYLQRDEHGVLSLHLGTPKDGTAELIRAADTLLTDLEGFIEKSAHVLDAWEKGTPADLTGYLGGIVRLAVGDAVLRSALARVRGAS